MLTKAQKTAQVEELVQKVERAKFIVFVDPKGIGVNKLRSLRRILNTEKSDYKMYKKKLIKLAFDKLGVPGEWLLEFKGSAGMAVSYDPDHNIAKPIHDFLKKEKKLEVVGGVLAGKHLEAKEVLAIAKLPTKEVLLAQVVGGIASPIRSLMYVLQANIRGLVVVLSKIQK